MVFAHGFGGAQDLPIPLEYALAGAGAALAVSFIVLALAWRSPRYDAAVQGRPMPGWFSAVVDSPAFGWSVRGLGMAFTLYVGWAALAGQDRLTNPVFGVMYVLLWVGLVPASLLFGPFYRALNPVRTIHLLVSRATGGDPGNGVVPLPSWVGLWPAALGLFAFVYMELVYPNATYLDPVRLWFAAYFVVGVVGALLFGDRWIASADPFEAFSTLVGHLSVFGRRADGTLVLRSPLANLDAVPPSPGLLAVIGVLLGSTAFDSFKDSIGWIQFTQSVEVSTQLLDLLALTAFCLAVMALFAGATMLTGVHAGHSRWQLPRRFAHTVVPIIVGYFVAHYLTFFYEQGQQTLIFLSDPLSNGSNLLGTADLQISYFLSEHQQLLAVVKVLAVVVGHVLGVVASHDRAVRLLPRRHQLTGQLPLLGVMVFFTVSGLYLLLSD